MQRTGRTTVVIGLLLAIGTSASAQLAPAELSEPAFLGPNSSTSLQQLLGGAGALGDKNNPIRLNGQIGLVHEFLHKGDPILVISGTAPIDFGADVVLPSGQLVLKDWMAIFSRKDASMVAGDFPAELNAKLLGFWPGGAISLYAKGFVLRAEPTGELLDNARSFLQLDRITGRTVLAFTKSAMRRGTGLMLLGTIDQPFGMDMTLTNPEMAYTRKEGKPDPVVSLASNVVIYGHNYEFKAEGSNPKKPDIFVLKTESLNPQDIVNIGRAFSKPVFDLAQGTDPRWRFDLIPTFSLRPPTTASPNFPTEDQSKVVVYAAKSSKPEWKVTGPGVKIRGRLQVDLMPTKQDIAIAEVSIDKEGMDVDFLMPSFKLPNSDLSFGTAHAAIGASANSAFMKISAESGNNCFKQKFSFAVPSSGIPKVEANLGETASALTPDSFMGTMKGCADDAQRTAAWALKTGEQLFGFGKDKLLDASVAVFGPEPTAYAAKVLSYPRNLVGTALGKVLPSKDALFDLGRKVYDGGKNGKLYDLAIGAGGSAVDVVNWAAANKIPAEDLGSMISPIMYGASTTNGALDAAAKVYPRDQLALIAHGAGVAPQTLGSWFKSRGFTAGQAGTALKLASQYGVDWTMEAGSAYDDQIAVVGWGVGWGAEKTMAWLKSDRRGIDQTAQLIYKAFEGEPAYNAARSVYGLGKEGIAEFSKKGGWTATTLTHWYNKVGLGKKEIATCLRRGGYAKGQVTDAMRQVYDVSSGAAEDLWDDAVDAGGRIGGWLNPAKW